MKKIPVLLFLFYLIFCSISQAQWVQTNGPEGGTVKALIVSGDNIFAGTIGRGVYRSTNKGSNWENTGLKDLFISSMALSGNNIYAGTDDGVYLSTDNGSNWENIGLKNLAVTSLAASGSLICAGTDGSGLYLSTDNGTNWENTGLEDGWVLSLAISSSNIFAGTDQGVYLSTDNGTNWKNTGLEEVWVFSLAIRGTDILAGTNGGVYLSTDNGSNWDNLWKDPVVYSLGLSGANIFLGAYEGIYLSTDGGLNWDAVNNGLTNTWTSALASDGTNIIAGTNGGGIYLSSDNGSNWNNVNTGLINSVVYSMAVSGNKTFAGTGRGGIYVSTDKGLNWTYSGLQNSTVLSLEINGNNIFAGTGGDGVYLSTDGGANWVISGLSHTIVTSFGINGSNIFAGTQSGIFLTTDNGATWNSANTGLQDLYITSFAVSGNNLFAGTRFSEVYLSTNNGLTWNPANNGLPDIFITSLAVSGENIFAGTDGDGVYLSTDNGADWYNTGLVNIKIKSLAVSGTDVFAGTFGEVWHTTDSGSVWYSESEGLPKADVLSLAIRDTNIFAGTGSGGIFRSFIDVIPDQWYNNNTGIIEYSVFNNGFVGRNDELDRGTGFKYLNNDNALSFGGILLGSQERGISGTIGSLHIQDMMAESFIERLPADEYFDNITECIISDNLSPSPYGLSIHQETFSQANSNIFYVKYTVANNSSSGINDLFIGQFADWDIGDYLTNDGGKVNSHNLVYQYGRNDDLNYYGLIALDNFYGGISELESPDDRDGLFLSMTSTEANPSGTGDFRSYISSGPYNIAAGDTIKVGFAYAGAPDLEELKASADEAIALWNSVIVDVEEDNISSPVSFNLYQSYPNPFNPSAIIPFDIPNTAEVKLTIYDILGREVKVLINDEIKAGHYEVTFDAHNLSSGTYFYVLRTNNFVESKKMILLK